jgi:hypothetical protein
MEDALMKLRIRSFRLAIMALAASGAASGVELDQRSLQIWDEYVKTADSEVGRRISEGRPFLRIDDFPKQQKLVQEGEVVTTAPAGHGMRNVPRGLIHDWVGSIFIPNATLEKVLAVVRDYANYKEVYSPMVASSKLVRCSASEQDISMVWLHHSFVRTFAIESELRSRDHDIGNGRWYNVTFATKLQEIADFGQKGEHLVPPDQGSGLLWRVHSITKYEQRDGGTYVELEGMALTRDIPLGIRWLVKPIVEELSRVSIAGFLRRTRDAVNGNTISTPPSSSCTRTVSNAVPSP